MSSPPPPDDQPPQPYQPGEGLTSGQIFAGYKIVQLLGSGGMGEVYLAQHPRLPRLDALKLLPLGWSSDDEYRIRFNREADLASTMWHPNIVGVHDRGEDDGQLWISMDYVDGLDAARLAAERYPAGMPAEDVARIVTAVANALDSAHKRGLLHRDVKPANIMLTHLDDDGDQRILLTDFGIAHDINDNGEATTSNMTVGTVAYCAPEQLRGEEVGGPADQYALAATAYRLLSGTPLFSNTDPEVVIDHQLHTPPPALAATRPELAALDPVLAVALAKRPEDRFARCSDFARAFSERVDAMHAQPPYVAPDVVDTAPAGIAPPPWYHPAPVEPSIADRVTASFSVDPRAMQVKRERSHALPILVGLAAALIVALATWLLWPSGGSDSSAESTASSTSTPVDSAAQNRLSGLLPAGYPAESCKPAEAPNGVQAKVSCTANSDAGGPPAATYTLAGDKAALKSAFDGIVSSSTMVNCPGNIQSPGPWRRNATPQLVSGTLFCGFRGSVPIVVWTDDANLVLSSVEGAKDTPNLDELYVWWTSHS
ncbi:MULTISPECIES: serine/threonine-protein kinase [unclassified Mycobacterium]|uniref:serine/threonine-protein kinase n=1 Tax=unclassified Mycobacterium TaxID=2642494 RepID=UPI0029C98E0A|nr:MULTISPECIES: serine/threonine-protein kinase [unclassified Mycobacterium]